MSTSRISEGEFDEVRSNSGFKTAVICFQDQIPSSIKKEFTIEQWIFVQKLVSGNLRTEAWTNIQEKVLELDYFIAKNIFEQNSDNIALKTLAFDQMCRKADGLGFVSECINCLEKIEDKRQKLSGLLEKLSKFEEVFYVWTSIFFDARMDELRKVAFLKAKESKVEFHDWLTFVRGLDQSGIYFQEGFVELRERAKTFSEKQAIYFAFSDRPVAVVLEPLKELFHGMESIAQKVRELVWIYTRLSLATSKSAFKTKILAVQGSFHEWNDVNQSHVENWLKELSLKRMKETAEAFEHQSIIWCRDSSEAGKINSCFKMIEMSSTNGEAKLAWHRARSTSLEPKARKKLRKIATN